MHSSGTESGCVQLVCMLLMPTVSMPLRYEHNTVAVIMSHCSEYTEGKLEPENTAQEYSATRTPKRSCTLLKATTTDKSTPASQASHPQQPVWQLTYTSGTNQDGKRTSSLCCALLLQELVKRKVAVAEVELDLHSCRSESVSAADVSNM